MNASSGTIKIREVAAFNFNASWLRRSLQEDLPRMDFINVNVPVLYENTFR